MKQERAALDRKFAEMALQLDQQQAKTKSTNDKAKVSTPLRELPEKAKVLGRVPSAKGLYKADGADGRQLHSVPRYDSMDPVPHSLDALAASGALEDSPRGVPLMSYLVGGFPGDLGAIINANAECKETTKKILELQALVRDYGEELVAAGLPGK